MILQYYAKQIAVLSNAFPGKNIIIFVSCQFSIRFQIICIYTHSKFVRLIHSSPSIGWKTILQSNGLHRSSWLCFRSHLLKKRSHAFVSRIVAIQMVAVLSIAQPEKAFECFRVPRFNEKIRIGCGYGSLCDSADCNTAQKICRD